jgi:hypothetical protein
MKSFGSLCSLSALHELTKCFYSALLATQMFIIFGVFIIPWPKAEPFIAIHEPPVVDASFYLAANVTNKRFCLGHLKPEENENCQSNKRSQPPRSRFAQPVYICHEFSFLLGFVLCGDVKICPSCIALNYVDVLLPHLLHVTLHGVVQAEQSRMD